MEKVKSEEFIKLCKEYGVNPDNVPEVLSFEAACKITGDDSEKLPGITDINPKHSKRVVSDYKLSIIAEALGGGDPDYTDMGQYKYNAVFEVDADEDRKSGFGLSFGVFDGWLSRSSVGVRLCFPTRDQARFFGKHFIGLHKDHQLLT